LLKTLRQVATALLAGFAVAFSGPAQPAGKPAKPFVRECPGNAFCFNRPVGLVAQTVRAVDSLAGEYRGDGLVLIYDMGRFGTSVEHLVKPARQGITIDGRTGELLTSEREIVLLLPKVHETFLGALKFSMTLKSEGKVSPELALRIFQSIEFMPQR